ncbi:MAG: hypothetical protein IJL67_02150 [Oscillospiraceae bacterium]|nr:hypothetical protein [Oscillospiraceae bacterium]
MKMPRIMGTSARGALDYVMNHFCEPGITEYPEYSDSYAVISIQDTSSQGFGFEFRENKYCRGVLTLYFDDIEKTVSGLHLLNHSQALEMIRFIRAHEHDVDTLLIHCFAGLSRSAAVGMIAHEIYGLPVPEKEYYNRHVYDLMKRCLKQMKVSVYSRKDIEAVIKSGKFPADTAAISFYDPPEYALKGYEKVDYSSVTDNVFYVALPDIDWDSFGNDKAAVKNFFPEAEDLAKFILKAYDAGHSVICQCDYGQSRSAGCAMAILEYFDHAGNTIFEDPKYFPNQLVFGKVCEALKRAGKKGAVGSEPTVL